MDYIKIGNLVFPTLVAMTAREQEQGLMNKVWPPPVMSFVYAKSSVNKFWMKNTPSPLDIVFCNNNKIISICKGNPNSLSVIGGDYLSDLVIEFPAETCETYNIDINSSVELQFSKTSLMKFFMLKNGLHI